MSVIWSGITEQGAVVPVQVDETGKVIATASIPADYVLKSGDTMTGPLVLPGNPQNATEAATKQYVDSALAPNTPIAYGYSNPTFDFVGAFNIGSARKTSVGLYQFYFDQIPPSDNYLVIATSQWAGVQALWTDRNILYFSIQLVDSATGYQPVDSSVNFAVYWAPNQVKISKSE